MLIGLSQSADTETVKSCSVALSSLSTASATVDEGYADEGYDEDVDDEAAVCEGGSTAADTVPLVRHQDIHVHMRRCRW